MLNLEPQNTFYILGILLGFQTCSLIFCQSSNVAKITIVVFFSMQLNFLFRTFIQGESSTRASMKLVFIQSMEIFSSQSLCLFQSSPSQPFIHLSNQPIQQSRPPHPRGIQDPTNCSSKSSYNYCRFIILF
jgi:hypothetical protein